MIQKSLVATVLSVVVGCAIVSRDPNSVQLDDPDLSNGSASGSDAGCGSNDSHCESAAANCGVVLVVDDCGAEVAADCGVCTDGEICVDNACSCLPKTTEELCQSAGKDCGMVAVEDCGAREVNCGECADGGCGEEAPNVCGCPCLIDGVCWAEGAYSPDNPCLRCDSALDSSDWSSREGEACEDDDACTVDTVCNGDGGCRGVPKDCSAVARECQEPTCRSDGSCGVRPLADGAMCASDDQDCTLDRCAGGVCKHALSDGWCVIDASCLLAGARSPRNSCEVCDPDRATTEYSAITGNCDDGDGLACTAGRCVEGVCNPGFVASAGNACYIDSACFGHRQANPDNTCQVCSAAIPLMWLDALDGKDCVVSGSPGTCEDGVCN